MALSERFSDELAVIGDPVIRDFARKGLDCAPAYLATIPASVSGRHHPPDERKEGGRILHIKRVARLVHEMADQHQWTPHHRDKMVAAALLHDIVVMGVSHIPTDRLQRDHDWLGPEYLEEHGAKSWTPNPADRFWIYDAMKGHMGRFASKPLLVPKAGTPAWYLHQADYFASLPWVRIETFGEVGAVTP